MNKAIDRKRMKIAFIANLSMFFVGIIGWYFAHSTGLLADSFDMLADASGYAVTFFAIDRSKDFQKNAARWNGVMLIFLGFAVIGEIIHHLLIGAESKGFLITVFALISLVVNGSVLSMLSVYKDTDEAHLKATWRDTHADVIVNLSVFISGVAIMFTGYDVIDLILGFAIGLYVIKEGFEILNEAN